jgi:hypothetical protein
MPKKRKRDVAAEPEALPEISDDDPRLDMFTDTPQQTRRKIQRFIDGGHMKVGEFQKAIGCGPGSYQRFMKMTGRQGEFSDTYQLAARFFKKRELQGLKAVPTAKKTKTATTSATTTSEKTRVTKNKDKDEEYLDVSDISIAGEETKNVPVYDTCDEVRKKIRAVLRRGIAQTALCRAITKHCLPEGQVVRSPQITSFLAKKGPLEGNTSIAFYGSYVFFEKRRLKDGKPKSEFREDMERIHGKGGVCVDKMVTTAWCLPGEVPYIDRYGECHIS